jgi:hypothetical protein
MFTILRHRLEPDPAGEPAQALSRDQFAHALALHGFAATITPFGVQFIDRRRGRRLGAAIGARAADGRPYLDRLATLHQLLALRRAGDELALRRRLALRRLFAWILPAPALPAPVAIDRHPPPRR